MERRGWVAAAVASAATMMGLAAWLRFGAVPVVAGDPTPWIVDRHGIVLYAPLSSGGTRSEWIRTVPSHIAAATIAAEDRRFERHPGIDPIAIGRAAVHNAMHLRVVEGGSTISQQVAKLILSAERRRNGDGSLVARVPAPRTWSGKVEEAVLALRLEHRYDKSAILGLYLNLAPYGEQTIGIARASRRYFGCAPEDLTMAQAAWLASLPQRPSTPRRALARQRTVLARMRASGMLDEAAWRDAKNERLVFARETVPLLAPHFVERVMETRPRSVRGRIVTTLDAGLQRDVRGILAAARQSLLHHGAHSVAVAVLDNRTGEWLAWEGSGDYFGGNASEGDRTFGGAIDGVITPRQPGSALKPFTYAVAFEQGVTPATVLADVPSHFATAEAGIVYTPRNYDGHYRGPLRARMALAGSENVPAVALLSRIGVPSLLRFLRAAGFSGLTSTADTYGLGLTLGDAEVTLQQLVAAYATLARGGLSITPRIVPCQEDVSGEGMEKRLMSVRSAFWITDILSDSAAREYAFGRGGALEFPFPVAVKTGTSQAYRDNWTVGYTREVSVGVWVGNFDRQELRNSSGVTGAGPIFHSVMLAANRNVHGAGGPIVDRPSDLESQPVCLLSGQRPSLECPATGAEWLPGDAPVTFCDWHHRGRVSWPAEYGEWAGMQHPQASPAMPRAVTAALRIVNPRDGSTYLIDPTLRSAFQALPLRAAADSPVRWRVDGRLLTSAEWPLQPGRHTIQATDASGRRDQAMVTVK